MKKSYLLIAIVVVSGLVLFANNGHKKEDNLGPINIENQNTKPGDIRLDYNTKKIKSNYDEVAFEYKINEIAKSQGGDIVNIDLLDSSNSNFVYEVDYRGNLNLPPSINVPKVNRPKGNENQKIVKQNNTGLISELLNNIKNENWNNVVNEEFESSFFYPISSSSITTEGVFTDVVGNESDPEFLNTFSDDNSFFETENSVSAYKYLKTGDRMYFIYPKYELMYNQTDLLSAISDIEKAISAKQNNPGNTSIILPPVLKDPFVVRAESSFYVPRKSRDEDKTISIEQPFILVVTRNTNGGEFIKALTVIEKIEKTEN